MRFNILKTVFFKELREILRDRRSLAVMFGVPLVLYPLLTVALATLGHSKINSLKETKYKIAITNPQAAPNLASRLADSESGVEVYGSANPMRGLRAGEIDGIIDIPQGFEPDLLSGKNPSLTIQLDRSRTEADFVERKINHVVADYQSWIITQRLKHYGAPADVTNPIERNTIDVATDAQRMGNRLAQLLPLLVLITGMLGALFPALAATTTERELGTLETLLVTPARRMELLLAKGFLVLLCGLATAGLNMLSMALVLWRVSSLVSPQDSLSISVSSLVFSFVTAVPALVFFTAVAMIVGLLARTFREANSYATPAMLLPIASLALSIADVKTTPGLLVTPIASTTLVMRDVLRGKGSFGDFSIAALSSFLYAGLLIALAARLFSNEQLVNPSWEPLSLKGLARNPNRRRRLPAIDEAIALFSFSLLLLFYIQPSLTRFGLFITLIVTNLALLFAPALLFAWIGKWDWRASFQWFGASLKNLSAATLIGVGLVPVVGLFEHLQGKFWPSDPVVDKMSADLIIPALTAHPFFCPLLVGALAGIFEELLFRGPIQTSLLRRGKPWTAIIITAVVFAAAHLDLHGLPLRAILGVILGWSVWRTGSIFPGMLIHGLYDACTLAWAGYNIRVHGLDAQPIVFDTSGLIRLSIGTLFIAVGVLLIIRSSSQKPAAIPAAIE